MGVLESQGQFVTDCTDLKNKFYLSPSNFFKIARQIVFGVFSFQDFSAPSLQNDSILANGKHSQLSV